MWIDQFKTRHFQPALQVERRLSTITAWLRTSQRAVLMTAAVVSIGTPAVAQDTNSAVVRVGGVGGLGRGPSPTIMYGVQSGFAVTERFEVDLEASRWIHGLAACDDRFPSVCSGGGSMYLGGVRGVFSRGQFQAYLRLLGGVYRFSGAHDARGQRIGAGLKGAAGLEPGVALTFGRVALNISGRGVEVFDDGEYRESLGEPLSYRMLTIGLSYRFEL